MKNYETPRTLADAFGPGARLHDADDLRALRRLRYLSTACWAVGAFALYALLASFGVLPWAFK